MLVLIAGLRDVQEFEVCCFELVDAFFQFKVFLGKLGLELDAFFQDMETYLVFDGSESFVQELTCPL
jgi:hypothetical protein